MKAEVAEWKRQRREVFVPLVYRLGDLAEVDFFQVLADVAGVRVKAWMFVMRLMHSGRDFAYLYERQDQVSFLDGHVRAFDHFGAVPQRIAYQAAEAWHPASPKKSATGGPPEALACLRRSLWLEGRSLVALGSIGITWLITVASEDYFRELRACPSPSMRTPDRQTRQKR